MAAVKCVNRQPGPELRVDHDGRTGRRMTATPSPLLLARIRRKRRTAADARTNLRRLIVQARRQGHTLDEISRAAGLTPQRVSQIVHEIRPAGTPMSGSAA